MQEAEITRVARPMIFNALNSKLEKKGGKLLPHFSAKGCMGIYSNNDIHAFEDPFQPRLVLIMQLVRQSTEKALGMPLDWAAISNATADPELFRGRYVCC